MEEEKTKRRNRVPRKNLQKIEEQLKQEDPSIDRSVELYSLLATHKSNYSIEHRIQAVMLYIAEGALTRVSRKMGIPYDTLKDWKDTDWWPLAMQECRKKKQDELDAMLSKTIHSTVDEVYDRIKEGDWIVKKMEPVNASQ